MNLWAYASLPPQFAPNDILIGSAVFTGRASVTKTDRLRAISVVIDSQRLLSVLAELATRAKNETTSQK